MTNSRCNFEAAWAAFVSTAQPAPQQQCSERRPFLLLSVKFLLQGVVILHHTVVLGVYKTGELHAGDRSSAGANVVQHVSR